MFTKQMLLSAALVLMTVFGVQAIETPFTPVRDGHANLIGGNNSRAKSLEIISNESKAWVEHKIEGLKTDGLRGARLLVFIKEMNSGGTLEIYAADEFESLEGHVVYNDIQPRDNDDDSPLAEVKIKDKQENESLISIPLHADFIDKIDKYAGLVLIGSGGLDIKIGSLESGRGAVLFMDYTLSANEFASVVDDVKDSVVIALAKDETNIATQAVIAGLKGDSAFKDSVKGDKGDKGDTGAKGETGPAGPQGPAGVAGPAGPVGPIGPQGVQGEQGAVGPGGAKGEPGADGLGINWRAPFTIDSTYNLNNAIMYNGSAYIAIRETRNQAPDTSGNWRILAMKGDRGVKGETGPAGPTGRTGPQGVMGVQGAVGPDGPQGKQGLPGPQGQHGHSPASSSNNDLTIGTVGDSIELILDNNQQAFLLGQQVRVAHPDSATQYFLDGQIISYDSTSGLCSLIVNYAQGVGKSDSKWTVMASGMRGEAGEKGEPGDQGPEGLQGLQGEQGAVGPAGPQGPPGTSAWTDTAGNVTTNGKVGIGTYEPGEALDLRGGNILLSDTAEREVRIQRDDLGRRPRFKAGRIVTAGDGSPEFRFLYEDDSTSERSVLEFDKKGIVASVKDSVGSHFEGFIRGDSEPMFRLNSYPQMQLEMGPGGSKTTDVAIQRDSTKGLSLVTRGEDRVFVDSMGKVGIGTKIPLHPLHVPGGAGISGLAIGKSGENIDMAFAYESIGSDGTRWNLRLQSMNSILFHTGMTGDEPDDDSKVRVTFRSDGTVGIGTIDPRYALHVVGTIYEEGSGGALSDERHKTSITGLDDGALALVDELRPVRFEWKVPKDKGMEGPQLGFIAQEVEGVLPEAVLTQDDEEQTKGLKYSAIIPLLAKAIQELKVDIQELKAENDALKALLCSDYPGADICSGE